ncbi:MAG: accessory gene regulator B family protein [Ruminococcus sp.]|nr:accessory gene regulator B family protein [Ruminococcus sp.]
MKERFVTSSISFISKYETCDDKKLKQLRYGLEGIYSMFFKLTIVLIISLLTNTIKETSIFLLFYAGIRTCSYGIHAKNNLGCWISTITIYNIIPLLIKGYNIPNTLGYIILGLSFISMLLWAPADTPKKPLIRKKNRLICKTTSCFIVIVYTIFFIISENNLLNNGLIYALIIQSILINPITYKITNTKFNNYKYYKPKTQ